MAAGTTYSVSRAKHATLTGGNHDTVNLTYTGRYIQVIHRGSTTNPIYLTAGVATVATPTAAGDNTLVVTATVPLVIPWPVEAAGACQLVLISAGAEAYSVQVLGDRLS